MPSDPYRPADKTEGPDPPEAGSQCHAYHDPTVFVLSLHGLRGTMLVSPEKEVLLTEVETPFSLVTLRDSLVKSLLANPMSDMACEI